ncbi:MAG: XdhC family protein [Pseudomonadota bacterium]
MVSTPLMAFTDNPIAFLSDRMRRGEHVGLATLIAVDGSSPRPVGSQIAVAENGDSTGMITGGCAEAALITQTVHHMAAGSRGVTRYGAGSPYLDVKLPCGSGVDVHFEGDLTPTIVAELAAAQEARAPHALSLFAERAPVAHNPTQALTENPLFMRTYAPRFRLLIFGEGPYPYALATLATPLNFDIQVFSPDTHTRSALELDSRDSTPIMTHAITPRDDFSAIAFDPWTGVVTLFHDHEWEINILSAALASSASYIGALGSRKTHTARMAHLRDRGFSADVISAIHGPVGLDIGASDPNEIAISILAQIIALRRGQSHHIAADPSTRLAAYNDA